MITEWLHNPGSEVAIKNGCICAKWDNHYGKGVPLNGGRYFYVNNDCEIHGIKNENQLDGSAEDKGIDKT